MAAVLEEFLVGKISSKNLVLWLSSDQKVFESECDLLQDRSLRAEFLPFFINYLRDQTSHLIGNGTSSGASPAKTPASAQKFRRSSLQSQNPTESVQRQGQSDRDAPRRPNRTQLFSPSPLRSNVSEGTLTPKSLCSEDESPLKITTEVNSLNQGGHFYLKTPHDEYKGRTKRTSPGFPKKDEHLTLGQYIKSDGLNVGQAKGRRRSDQHYLREDASHRTPSSNTKRRSGGKASKTSYSDGSLKTKARTMVKDPGVPEFVLDDSEDFPAVGTPSTVATIPTRRITPTTITIRQKTLATREKQQSLASPVFSKSYQEEPSLPGTTINKALPSPTATPSPSLSSQGLEKERELLRLERLKQQVSHLDSNKGCPSTCSPLTPQTPTKSTNTASAFPYPTEFTKASRDKVTYQDHVDKLVDLYSACTKECLMPNLTMELYFLVHLLTAKGSTSSREILNDQCDPEDVNYLCSIHNCVYFAVSVLLNQFWLLTFLDKTTLRLLSEVPHLSDFSPVLRSQLETVVEGGAVRPAVMTSKSPVQAVPFLADTDNRRNFPSEVAFHSFKKQRDKFYELVREWLSHRNKPGCSMQAAMSKRIRDLIQHVVEVSNCTHFARLFSSQLTRMCQGEHLISDRPDDSKERGFLGDLRKTNPEKFKRLEERFFIPTMSGGPSPPPAFHGCQEFFKEFILAADSFLFNQHLIDNFSSKILELNELQLGLSEQDGDTESAAVDDEVRSSFSSSLQSARILAKFLGFLVFLPYQGGNVLPESAQGDVIALRNKCCPPVDILESLREACRQHRLVITVPWVVEYLSMMDAMAAQLEAFQQLLRLLVQVYRQVSVRLSSDASSYNMLLILLVLGWLFEVPGVPASMYFLSFADDFVLDETMTPETPSSQFLDNLHLVDQQLLYLCCPYLGDIRVLLTDASLGFGSKTTPMKKITPIAAKTPPQPIQSSQQLQLELEKNFFDNYSPSLKKTVDFVSSRLASNCIKHIDARLVTAARDKAVALLEEEVKSEEVGAPDEDWTDEMKRALLRRVKVQGEDIAVATRETAVKQAKEFIFGRSRDALSLLLSQESSGQVIETAAYITGRLAMERATRWINTQIQAAIHQELSTGVDRAIRTVRKETPEKPQFSTPVHHDRGVSPPSAILQQYKDTLRYLLTCSTNHQVTVDDLAGLLTATRQVLQSRQDLTPVAQQTIQQLSMELVCALAVFKPAYLRSRIQFGNRILSTNQHGRRGGPNEKRAMTPIGLDQTKDSTSSLDVDRKCLPSTTPENLNELNHRNRIHACTTNGVSPTTCCVSGSNEGNRLLENGVQDRPVLNGIWPAGHVNSGERTRERLLAESLDSKSSVKNCALDGSHLLNNPVKNTSVPCDTVTSLREPQSRNAAAEQKNSSFLRSQSGKDDKEESVGRESVLEAFVELWRDHFKCSVPAPLFLCPKVALLIQQSTHDKERWDSVGHVVCSLLTHKLTDSTAIGECVMSLLQSGYVSVTEAMVQALWAIVQHPAYVGQLKHAGATCETGLPNKTSLLHALIARCPEGDILQQLCDHAQRQQTP